jgi:DEAD/DEAH box helicase domain-containing protein
LGRQALFVKGMAADLYQLAGADLIAAGILIRTSHPQGDTLALNPDALCLETEVACIATAGSKRRLAVPRRDAEQLLGMPCLDAVESHYDILIPDATDWWARRYSRGDLRRVIAAEHTGLLERSVREALEGRFKDKDPRPWYENLLSATPTLEMGVDIGDLSSVLLCSVPPSQASFLQRVGRAGRRDGNAMTTTLADGNSPHDLYFFAEPMEMMAGEVDPPGVFLQAPEVLRRQLFAFCMDDWVATLGNPTALPDKTSQALDALEQHKEDRFPYIFRSYVLVHEQRLFDGFVGLLINDLSPPARDRLMNYMQGQGEADGLRTRLLKVLEELVEERRSYKKRKDELDRTKVKLQKRPQDEATQAEIDTLLRERDKLLELIKEINTRDLLNTLTDAGLIPNYAFPEAGVELKSVLWRKRGADEPGEGAYVTLTTLKYERPAQSALSEFAPENRFYANQRRVEVDQINMNLAKTEEWRFCPSCQHMQNLTLEADVHPSCPRCSDAMWADAAQKRTLLRFKQAIANSNDPEVRIDDSSEDREPRYYVRQLLADFLPTQVREAWQIASGALPFGFEFIARVTFRDVNFGELAKSGENFKVGDKEAERPGFRLCQHCGKVQKPPRRTGDPPAQTHSFDCPKHGSEDPANLLECLYLYREFESEALRILVPYTKSGMDDRVVQSFMAAVQLGLKRRFGGKVDHLRMVLQDEPGKDGAPRKYFVMLYDSVPGGTGYLHQLLAQDAGTLAQVLRLALDALTQCACNQAPEKDGCYRCLYQYRLGRTMEKVSRDIAKAVLTELVASLDQLERVATISDIYINPNFDSVLEARFVESLKRLGGVGTLPTVNLVQDIVNGKSGYVLELGTQRYRIELQCELGLDHGVAVPSKPDFVFWPWSAGAGRRPVAVFCDGWAYHKACLREDARKRSAIVASGRFWVWSVTHGDVAAALNRSLDTDLESPLVAMSRHDGSTASPTIPRAQERAYTQHAVAQLLHWLAVGNDAQGQDAALEQLQRNALWLGFLMVPASADDKALCTRQWGHWAPRLPQEIREPGKGFAPILSQSQGACTQVGWWPLVLAKGGVAAKGWSAPGVVVLDEGGAEDEEALHLAWRRWLQLFNAGQVLPGVLLTTASGLDGHDYDGLSAVAAAPGTTPAQAADQAALNHAWTEVLGQVLDALRPGLTQLARAGAPLPEVGPELADAKGRVLADAELAWGQAKVAVLRPDQEDLVGPWQEAQWHVALLDDTLAVVSGQPWQSTVAPLLGLTLNEED